MDEATMLNEEDYFYGDDLLEHLSKDLKWPSLLDAADASPSEILADAAPILIPPISPILSIKSSPAESSISDSGSDDDSKNSESKSSPIDWLNGIEDSSSTCLNIEDVEQFLQTTSTRDKSNGNILVPSVRPPEHKGPVMAIENGIIKVEGIKRQDDQQKADAWNNNNNFFRVVNENSPTVNSQKCENKLSVHNGQIPLVLGQNNVACTFKKTTNVSSNSSTPIVISQNNKPTMSVPSMLKTIVNGSNTQTIKVQFIPHKNNIVTRPATANDIACVPVIKSEYSPAMENCHSPPLNEISETEIRAIKKQQRMIKNRESACQSRIKKRNYVSALEQQLMEAHQEIAQLRLENRLLKEQMQGCGRASRKMPRLDPSTLLPRKNVALIFAMIFMVSFNWKGLGWNNTRIPGPSMMSHRSTRHLLWDEQKSESSEMYNEGVNNTGINCHNNTNIDNFMNVNQTESIRIAGDLTRWIGSGKTLNWTEDNPKVKRKAFMHENRVDNGDILDEYRLFSKLNAENSFLEHLTNFPVTQGRNIRDKTRLRRLRRHKDMDFVNSMVEYPSVEYAKKMDNFNLLDDFGEWSSLLQALQRRDDTFYVVGVGRGEHLLLPAVSHNVTRPPKMSLILPARSGNDSIMSDAVTLMQIDCSVVNTTLVKLKSGALPESARRKPQHASNVNSDAKVGPKNKQRMNYKDSVDVTLLDVLQNASKNISNNQIKLDKHVKVSGEGREDYFVKMFNRFDESRKNELLRKFPKNTSNVNMNIPQNHVQITNGVA